VHAPSEEKRDGLYEELEQVFGLFFKKHMKILLGDINANVGKENILKPTLGMKVYMRVVKIMVLE